MPVANPSAVRKQIAAREPEPVYLIVGDDDVEMTKLANEFVSLIDEELRAFSLERLYATDKSVTPSSIVEASRTVAMLGDRRVVVVLRAERILKPKRRGKAAEDAEEAGADEEPASDLDVLEAYIKKPEPLTTLVLVAADVDRQRKVYKALQKHAVIVECLGLRAGQDPKRVDLRQAARVAEQMVRQAVTEAGQQIDAPAAKLIADRAGADIATLRADVSRLLLYAAGKPKITLQDVKEVVSAEATQDDWAVTNAIARGDAPEALRQLGLTLEGGGVSYQILGQLAWFVREKMTAADPRRIKPAVEALFRTDLELKSSGGDPRVLLERLVVELCRR
jgi:DNA polymerase III delta subunit